MPGSTLTARVLASTALIVLSFSAGFAKGKAPTKTASQNPMMLPIPEPRYKQAEHPRLKVNEWRAEAPATRINDAILMSTDITNAYVITSDAGDLVINTGMPAHGRRHRERFEQLLGRPLKVVKIVFTQDHADQTGGWEAFADPGVDLVGQRTFETISAERAHLGPFFAKRNGRILHAIQEKIARQSTGEPRVVPKPIKLTTTFADNLAFTLGGRRIELIATPSAETFDALAAWLPKERVLFTGNFLSAVFGVMPNFSTLRGDRQRSVPGFLRELQRLIDLNPDVLITGHGEPLKGAAHIRAELNRIRDAVRYVHDETLRRMVAGESLDTIMQQVELPADLELSPLGRGPTRWTVRAVWEEYTGWFRQELTSELYATPASAVWPAVAALAGGARPITRRAEDFLTAGEPEKALHLIEIAVAAAPEDPVVRTTEARVLVALIDRTGGVGFDEIGWLESKLRDAREKAAPHQN